jgi:hypothetical protein
VLTETSTNWPLNRHHLIRHGAEGSGEGIAVVLEHSDSVSGFVEGLPDSSSGGGEGLFHFVLANKEPRKYIDANANSGTDPEAQPPVRRITPQRVYNCLSVIVICARSNTETPG